MDHILENKFLNKELAQREAFSEDDELFKQIQTEGLKPGEQAEFQIYESFVKEKNSLLGYIQAIVSYSAIKQDIDGNLFYSAEVLEKVKEHKIKTEQDIRNIKNRIVIILERYQEQSGVLDSILEQMISPIMKFLQLYIKKSVLSNTYEIPKEISNLFEIIHYLCKVRGYKTIVKFFPHEVNDMEPVVEMLHFQETDEWWIGYVLILWLSIIVLVPFDIDTIDSKKNIDILVKRIINICKNHISNSGKIREATAVLLSKLMTRPDVIKSGETDFFLNYLAVEYQQTKDDANQMFHVSGILQTLTEIFKIGHREDLLQRVDTVFDPILKTEVKNKFMAKSTNLRKSKVQLAQRIGCIFLKPKVAKWRYQRGFRTLMENLQKSTMQIQQQQNQNQEDEDEEMEEEDINFEQLEYIIQYLLEHLKDEDSVVRWTSAKGLGRITGRLSKDFADQIVEQLFALFDDNETDSAWHGGCLALAELCRRGLLLPERLAKFVPTLDKALVYDINRGNHSIGAHVRDAACYVVWSFARAYAPEIMKPHVHTLSTQLIVESLFDREVNCRRAASATFQESVGRQGTFPHGIEILTEADYFTLSNRVNAFLNVSCFVAQFPDYFDSMVEHLAFIKLRHWEPAMRELSSQSLSVISVFNPGFITEKIMKQLIDLSLDKALHIRHGAILGVGEILIGLSGNSAINRKEILERAFKALSLKERKLIEESENRKGFLEKYNEISKKNYLDQYIPEESDLRKALKEIIQKVDSQRLYRGKGGEIMRSGVCHLIFSMSLAQIPLTDKERLYYFKTLLENFKHPNIEIQEEATKAFKAFCNTYLAHENPTDIAQTDPNLLKEIKNMFKPSSVDENVALTRGYNMALGVLSRSLYKVLTPDIFDTLIKNCIPKGKETDDAETRKQAVKSIIQSIQIQGINSVPLNILNDVLVTLYQCMNDYQIDRRGDVGSWVREEAMTSLTKFIRLLIEQEDLELVTQMKADSPYFYERYICCLLQQLSEKIDKVREIAGRSLQEFFKVLAHKVTDFSEKDKLVGLFSHTEQESNQSQNFLSVDTNIQDDIAYLPWRNADFVFNSLKYFFDSPVYSIAIFKGLITSSGGLTESTLKASSNSLFEYLSKMGQDQDNGFQSKKSFMRKIIQIFSENLRDERVTIPLMKTIEMLLASDYLSDQELVEELKEFHALCVQECNKNKNIVKLMSSAGVFSGMLVYQDQELLQKAIKSLLFLLYHSFPKVRKLTSEKLYTALLTMEDYSLIIPKGEEDYDAAIEMLSETNWSDQLKTIAHGKEKMYSFFGLEVQKSVPQSNSASTDDKVQIQT